MKPVCFGKKKALLLHPKNNHLKNRHQNIISALRENISVRMWEKNHKKSNILNNIFKNPYLIHPIIEKRINNKIESSKEYFLLLSNIDNKKICFFIEKKKPLSSSLIYQTRLRFNEKLFNGTLFTGYLTISKKDEKKNSERHGVIRIFGEVFSNIKKELNSFKKDKNWIFVITDILSYKNNDVSSSLINRLSIINNIIGTKLYPDSRIDVCNFEVIPYRNYNSIQKLLTNEQQYMNYTLNTNNVMFISINDIPFVNNYKICLSKNIKKNNSSVEKKVSFKNGEWEVINIVNEHKNKSKKNKLMYLKSSNYSDVYWVYNKDWKKCGIARIKTLEESEYIRKLFNNKSHIQIKCKWNSEFNKWQPLIRLK